MNYTEEILRLRDRVILGNEKLWIAWRKVCETISSEEYSRLAAQWDEANKKLDLLCTELKAREYTDCLYIDEYGNRFKYCLRSDFCWVCPSIIKYWDKEFELL